MCSGSKVFMGMLGMLVKRTGSAAQSLNLQTKEVTEAKSLEEGKHHCTDDKRLL